MALFEAITSQPFPELDEILTRRGFQRLERDPASGLVEWQLR
jgi:hypothetical protein